MTSATLTLFQHGDGSADGGFKICLSAAAIVPRRFQWRTSLNTNDMTPLERSAESASVEEIRQTRRQIEKGLPALEGDDKVFAEGLLLKLDRLIGLQFVAPVPSNVMAFPGRTPADAEESPAESEPVAA